MTLAFITGAALPRSGLSAGTTSICTRPSRHTGTTYAPVEIEASKHARLKAAKLKERRRPRKHRPSDINRKPPPYNVEPLRAEGLPSEYTVLTEDEAKNDDAAFSTILTAEDVKAIEDAAAEKAAAEAREEEEKRLARKAQSVKDKAKAKEGRPEKWVAFKKERDEQNERMRVAFEKELEEFTRKFYEQFGSADKGEDPANAEEASNSDEGVSGTDSEDSKSDEDLGSQKS